MRIPAHHLKTRCPREVQVGQQEKFLLRRSGAALHSCPGSAGSTVPEVLQSHRDVALWDVSEGTVGWAGDLRGLLQCPDLPLLLMGCAEGCALGGLLIGPCTRGAESV